MVLFRKLKIREIKDLQTLLHKFKMLLGESNFNHTALDTFRIHRIWAERIFACWHFVWVGLLASTCFSHSKQHWLSKYATDERAAPLFPRTRRSVVQRDKTPELSERVLVVRFNCLLGTGPPKKKLDI